MIENNSNEILTDYHIKKIEDNIKAQIKHPIDIDTNLVKRFDVPAVAHLRSKKSEAPYLETTIHSYEEAVKTYEIINNVLVNAVNNGIVFSKDLEGYKHELIHLKKAYELVDKPLEIELSFLIIRLNQKTELSIDHGVHIPKTIDPIKRIYINLAPENPSPQDCILALKSLKEVDMCDQKTIDFLEKKLSKYEGGIESLNQIKSKIKIIE